MLLNFEHFDLAGANNFCPGKEAAMGIIVVSLPCTTYQCGTLIVLFQDSCKNAEWANTQSR